MADDLLAQMRELRRDAERLQDTIVDDYRPFYSDHTASFVRLPSSSRNQINVTPTCTALMALSVGQRLDKFYPEDSDRRRDAVFQLMGKILAEAWDTGQMKPNNAFTTSLVLRAASVLVATREISLVVADLRRKHEDKETVEGRSQDITEVWRRIDSKSLAEICTLLFENAPDSFKVQDYPASATIAYWIIDATAGLQIGVDSASAREVVSWSAAEFSRQVSLVTANHHSMMDPVAMAMAACLIRALKRMSRYQQSIRQALESWSPTDIELVNAIRCFFEKQNSAGVWEKYFPIFHYPAAGPNHCWHFEVLEAILNEFPEILEDSSILDRIQHALVWLANNRLSYTLESRVFSGWNAGGDIQALRKGIPESWPTGVAHMFLSRLRHGLSNQIRSQVFHKYRDRVKPFRTKDPDAWHRFLDSHIPGGNPTLTVRKVLELEILAPAEEDIQTQGVTYQGDSRQSSILDPLTFRLHGRKSALLFGPPGTSKTSLAEAIAMRLGWPFVELSPSDFLGRGLEGIHNQVSEVLEDMSDLFGVVVLFDEMDALVQSRDEAAQEAAPLDVTQRFLTTSMLPKLSKLHKQRRVIYLMATNHLELFDPAIKRAGRFDVIVPIGPPSVAEKRRGLSDLKSLWFRKESNEDRVAIYEQFSTYVADQDTAAAIERFTFGEMDEFFDYLRRTFSTTNNLAHALANIPAAQSTFARETIKRATLINLSDSAYWKFNQTGATEFKIQ